MNDAESAWEELQRRAAESTFSGIRADSDDEVDPNALREAAIQPNASGSKGGNKGGQGGMMPPMMGGAGGAAGKPGVAGGMAPGVDPNAASALGGSALRSGAAPAAANTAALGTTGALGGPNGLGTGGPGGSTGGLGGLGGLGGGPMAAGGSDLPMVDTDGDGIPDTYMRKDVDSDGDGISDYDEWLRDNGGRLGSDPGGDNGGGPGGDDNGRYGTDPLPWDNDGPEIPPGYPPAEPPTNPWTPPTYPPTNPPTYPPTNPPTYPPTNPPKDTPTQPWLPQDPTTNPIGDDGSRDPGGRDTGNTGGDRTGGSDTDTGGTGGGEKVGYTVTPDQLREIAKQWASLSDSVGKVSTTQVPTDMGLIKTNSVASLGGDVTSQSTSASSEFGVISDKLYSIADGYTAAEDFSTAEARKV